MSSETAQLPKPNLGRVNALVNVETRDRYELVGERISIGRAEDNQLCLKNDVYVSSYHAEITFEGDVCWLNDLGSRNGTIKNADVLAAEAPVIIAPGDAITIGRTRLQVE